ncbi:glutamate receptor 2.7 [Ricinus communis]|uniref:Glutamate receptor n=1 Tax=Ricinus communis TaxID=3988 RepID=B9RNQ3_RICCO|nr:glutamate receptor 2.7 [Ricinus communis]EEF46821.1 glutamate receptor 2 plant, putative [Ricinus communis]|eukprot:XP_002515372.3 glutamate receptor 2.7 [Ricinus communis]
MNIRREMRKSPSKSVLSFSYFLSFIGMVMAQNTTILVNIGVVLDMDSSVGKMGLSCIDLALSDFYATHGYYRTRLALKTRDSMRDVVGAAAAALDLIKNEEVQAIIGPTTSMQADFVIHLGEKAQIPIISYSATSPFLTSISSPYFFRATQNDSTQVYAICAMIQAFGWREAVPIYVDNEYGRGIMPYLVDALQAIDTRIPYRSTLSPVSTDDQIVRELYKLMTMQTRVFIVHMSSSSLGSRFFTKVREVGMMSKGYVWIMTDGLTNFLSLLTPTAIDSMQGVLGVKPFVSETKELENLRVRWKRKFQQENPGSDDAELTIFGLWAYDAAIALSMAIEKAGTAKFGFRGANASSNYTDLAALKVSQNGPSLIQALSNTSFKSVTGDFVFVNGQLPSLAFQIVNVIGDGARELGFWTLGNGLLKNLSSITATNIYSNSKSNLASVIWPGDTTSVPKGWEIPTNGKKLRVGVPVKGGFNEFIKVTKDTSTNTNTVTGYCIDVFDAVVKALPYALRYEYIPFANPDGSTTESYNELIYQVYLGNFDAVVGDTTIIFNRSLYVDFTLPYTESGVYMVVPIKDKKKKNAWVFLKPLTWDLWATSFCFFVFIGFIVWILEHRINEEFRGPPSYQLSTSLYFSFSTMFFAQRERVVSNLARIVVIIWCFVVLILIQSYTASLTSLLTVQQLLPTVTDVYQLIKNGELVGYKRGSFVPDILKSLGFEETQLVIYDSVEQCHELLSKGSRNGGIAAAFDELPYMKVFLAKYCSKYTMVQPITKTDGFGFVFPRGSPLVPDISRAILNVTEGDQMKRIENAWFGKQGNCPDPSTSVSSNSLGLQSFWGLFLIAGIASVLALMIFAVMFACEYRQVLISSESGTSIWSRIRDLSSIFDQKDLKSHTFKKSEADEIIVPSSMGAPSPSIYSVHTDFPVEEEISSAEYSDTNPNDQALQEVVLISIQLADLNQETPTTEITSEW